MNVETAPPGAIALMTPRCSTTNSRFVPSRALVIWVGESKPLATVIKRDRERPEDGQWRGRRPGERRQSEDRDDG